MLKGGLMAVNRGKILHVEKIIEAGGNINTKDNNEATPLHKAIKRIFKVTRRVCL